MKKSENKPLPAKPDVFDLAVFAALSYGFFAVAAVAWSGQNNTITTWADLQIGKDSK